jgi:hypothetical protein
MKATGRTLMAIGLLITLVTGFKYITKEKVVEIGNLEITADKKHRISWSPLLGLGVVLLGGAIFFLGSKKN